LENKRAEQILPGSGDVEGLGAGEWPKQCIYMCVNVKIILKNTHVQISITQGNTNKSSLGLSQINRDAVVIWVLDD
jgi:hypothetical protein